MMYLNKFAQYFGLKINLLRGLKEKDKTKTSFNTNEPFENMKKKNLKTIARCWSFVRSIYSKRG